MDDMDAELFGPKKTGKSPDAKAAKVGNISEKCGLFVASMYRIQKFLAGVGKNYGDD